MIQKNKEGKIYIFKSKGMSEKFRFIILQIPLSRKYIYSTTFNLKKYNVIKTITILLN